MVEKKPHKCNVCDASFSGKVAFNRHKKFHEVDKTFKCDICDKIFPRRQNFWSHKVFFHGGKKPFKCNHCDSSFTQNSVLLKYPGMGQNFRLF